MQTQVSAKVYTYTNENSECYGTGIEWQEAGKDQPTRRKYDVGCERRAEKKKKVVVWSELQRAIIYNKMSKQVTNKVT
jgi:hypothetical protein